MIDTESSRGERKNPNFQPIALLQGTDKPWFELLDKCCSQVRLQATTGLGNQQPRMAIGYFIYPSDSPAETNPGFLIVSTSPVREGSEPEPIEETNIIPGTSIIALPNELHQINLKSPSGMSIPLALSTSPSVILSDDGTQISVIPLGVDLRLAGLRIGEIAQVLQGDFAPVWETLSKDEQIALELLGDKANVLPSGFSLSTEPIEDDKIVIGPKTIASYLHALNAQPIQNPVTKCLVVTRNGKQMMIVPSLNTKDRIATLLGKASVDKDLDILEMLGEVFTNQGRTENLDFVERTNYMLKQTARMFEFYVFEKNEGEEFKLIEYPDEPEENKHMETAISFSRELMLQQKLIERLKTAGIPERSLVVGSMMGLLGRLKMSIIGMDKMPTVNIKEFEVILATLQQYGIQFVGSNLILPPIVGSKLAPAAGAEFAGLPYPQTYLIKNDKWAMIHPGNPKVQGLMSGAVLRSSLSSGGSNVVFLPAFKPDDSSQFPQGFDLSEYALYMRQVDLTSPSDPQHRVRDTRVIYDPYSSTPLCAHDRLGVPNSGFTNLRQGGQWAKSLFRERDKANLALLDREERGIVAYLTSLVYGEQLVQGILDMYQRLGMKPSIGMYGFDIMYPKQDYKKGTPFVAEIHHVLNIEQTDEWAIVNHIRRLAASAHLSTVVPLDVFTPTYVYLAHLDTRVNDDTVLVENVKENQSLGRQFIPWEPANRDKTNAQLENANALISQATAPQGSVVGMQVIRHV